MSNARWVCTSCKNQTDTPLLQGSLAMEIMLWIFGVLPGIAYSYWRRTAPRIVCPKCKRPHLAPVYDSTSRKMQGGIVVSE